MFSEEPDLVLVPQPETDFRPVEVDAANRAEDVRNQLVALRRRIDQSFLSMGAYMQEMRDQKYYKHFGYSNLEDFCFKELDYGGRQVRTFVRVYEQFVQKLGVDTQKLLEVGSTKLAKLVEVADVSNVDTLLAYARQNNVTNVGNHVAEILGPERLSAIEEQQGVSHLWQIWLTPAQQDFVNETLELAMRANGSEWVGAALEAICADFQAGLHKDATRTTLTFQVNTQEQNTLGRAIDQAREKGFQSVGALLAAGVEKLITAEAA